MIDLIQKNYVDEISYNKILESALQGILGNLDPHSDFLSASEFQEVTNTTKGNYGGIGIEILPVKFGLKVIAPLEDSPAQRAGIKAGDLIIAVEGKAITGMFTQKFVEELKGDPGTKILLTLKRSDSEIFDVALKREKIAAASVKSWVKDETGYIKISTFDRRTPNLVRRAYKDLISKTKKGNLRGLIIDVRNNAGGLLEEGILTTALFLKQGDEIVSVQGKDPIVSQVFQSPFNDITKGLPIVVLVNGGSASAAEILAGALQDHKRAIVVGTKSFGKGSVQRVQAFKNIGAMKLTVAMFYTPKKKLIQKNGISPDIFVEQSTDLKSINSNRYLREVHLKDITNNKNLSIEEKGELKKKMTELQEEPYLTEVQDYQLDQAFNILKTLSLSEHFLSTPSRL